VAAKAKSSDFVFKWVFTSTERASFIEIFKALDTEERGYLKEEHLIVLLKDTLVDLEVQTKILYQKQKKEISFSFFFFSNGLD
jgi:hypothetical protein